VSSARQALSRLRQLGVRLTVDHGKLVVRAPRGVLTAELRDELAAHKQEILELLAEGLSAPPRADSPISGGDDEGDAPLSFAQQRLWFLQRLAPENSSYNLASATRLQGALDQAALQGALDQLARRHGALRTTYPDRDGVPRQRLGHAEPVPVPVTDLSALPTGERSEQARLRVEQERRRPFRLETERPLRVSLWRLGEGDHVLLLVLHHISGDGWSLATLHGELASLYAAARGEACAPLPELTTTYADYARWERSDERRDVLDAQLRYWTGSLRGAADLALPADHARPPRPSFRGARESVLLPTELVRSLEALGRQEGASLFMTLVAAFSALLQRFGGGDDVVVGAPAANRNRTELEGLVGCFLNMLALRTDASGDPPFRELLRRTREVCLGAFRNQDVPFDSVVEEQVRERDLSRNPLFQVFFALQNAPDEALCLPGLACDPFPFDYGTTDLDLDVFASPVPEGLELRFLYATDLFGAATVRSLAQAYRALLEGAVARPDATLARLPLRSDDAEAGDSVLLGGSLDGRFAGRCLHELFEAQVRAAPDQVAVRCDGEFLTYAELDARADALAARLYSLGVGPDVLVGLAAERGLDLAVGLLGIAKAGGAYVPLDPSYPPDRLAWILEDARVAVLVSQAAVVPRLPTFAGPTLLLDVDGEEVGADATSRVAVDAATDAATDAAAAAAARARVEPRHLAYVIHTSGSTGRPKGVEITHGSLVAFLGAMSRRPGLGADDTLLALTTLSFDIAALELFLPLVLGATVEIATRELAADGHRLAQRLSEGDISACQGTPATWQMLVHAGWRGDGALTMLCGGEELPRALADALLERGGALWNMYGPTETTIWSAVGRVEAGAGPVPLGEPIDGTQLLVLDDDGRPVPRGAPGELCIGGAGVARGYLRRPDLTAERFVPSPCAEVPGRVYRTGDVVRRDAAGRLAFLGRADQQLKVRGHRIEPGEIETRLAEQPGVAQAVAFAHAPLPGETRLVAFWAPTPDGGPDSASLREALARVLPAYMLPDLLVRRESLPTTPAGKLDRKALGALVPTGGELTPGTVAPRDPVEQVLHDAFCDLLGHERVGVHDDFFALGGHSLLATRLVSRLRDAFGVEPTLSELFASPTVAGLARVIDVDEREGEDQEAGARATSMPLPRIPRDGTLPLSFAQQRLWLLDQMGSGAGYHMRLELGLSGPLDRAALSQALDALVARHETLRTRFVTEDGGPRPVIDAPGPLALAILERPDADTDARREAARHEHAVADGRQPFDLATGPLLRATLIACAHDEAVLVLSFHHVLADGRSYELLAAEIAGHYRQLAAGEPSGLPDLPVQYADFAAWQRGWLTQERSAGLLAFWKEQLAAGTPPLALPTDRPRPPVPSFVGAERRLDLGPELRRRLTTLAHEHDATLAMVCLAAFQLLLHRATGQDRIVLGSPMANRTRPEVEPLIGFFVNTLVLSADFADDPTFGVLLERVKRDSLAAYDHQDMPFEQLVEELSPTRDPSRTPLFQAVFAMNLLEQPDLEGAGVCMAILPPEISVTRFDLELHLFEGADTLEATLVYATDLFDADTMAGFAQRYARVLTELVTDPGRRASELPLVDGAERRALVEQGRGPAVPRPGPACVHERFEQLARMRPDAEAVRYHDQTLTYAELDGRANQLAHALRAEGAGRDVLVGLCVERGPDMLVGLLGILKAGAAYLPLDPAYPAERLAFMLGDADLDLLVSQEQVLASLPSHTARSLSLDGDAARLDGQPSTSPQAGARPQDLAYAIYTSGSTGTPKAALLEHDGLGNLSQEQGRAFAVAPGARVLQFSSLSFDAATFELVMALGQGATVVLGDRDELMPGPGLFAFLREHDVNVVTLPPTALAATPHGELPALQTITVAGEDCPAELVRRWAPGRRFFNLYGPTETTVWATTAALQAGDTPHLGRPLGNVQVHLLDDRLEPVPRGVAGEICIGGVGVARGYLRRPELSAERFVEDPFAPAPADDGARRPRLYRSGDLGRRLADGSIQFLGRRDAQVKLRGHRIEPGEVESVLERLPEVRQSLVTVREDRPGEPRLVAYVVCDPDAPTSDGSTSDAALEPATSPGRGAGDLEREHVSRWRSLSDQAYGEAGETQDPTFNTTAWNSSYTSEPLPADEMAEWLEHTVALILERRPRRVLEIGCGLGLILFRVAPSCVEYLGTDLSQAPLDYVARHLERLPEGSAAVRLERRPAEALSDLPAGHFDTVVINSVAQYLPSVEHLVRVLGLAAERLAPGGRIVLGDVRSLALGPAFHTSVALDRADGRMDLDVLRQRVRKQLAQEPELLVSPALFGALVAAVPRLAGATVEPKRGRYDNELSRYRYDVVLTLDETPVAGAALRWLEWGRDVASIHDLRRALEDAPDEALAVRGVPDGRVARDVAAAQRLLDEGRAGTVSDLLSSLDDVDEGLHPDDARDLASHRGRACRVSGMGADPRGRFDAVFGAAVGADVESAGESDVEPAVGADVGAEAGAEAEPELTAPPWGEALGPADAPAAGSPRWSDFGNRPLRSGAPAELVPRLRQHAASLLPESMLPAVFVVLDAFPVTPNGKIDREALPAPSALRPELEGDFAAPRDDIERALAQVWARTLGLDRVGIHDDFFALGGDSILCLHVVAGAREQGVVISVKALFQHPTVAELATVARSSTAAPAEQGVVTGALPLLPIQRWFLGRDPVEPHHFTQALLVERSSPMDPQDLERALLALCRQHDALRLRILRTDEGWTQELAGLPQAVPVAVHDLSGLTAAARAELLEAETWRVQSGLALDAGVLIAAALFRQGDGAPDTLLLVVHHLAVDAVSWTPLLQDLDRALDQVASGESPEAVTFPPKTTSLKAWAQALSAHARSDGARAQARTWLDWAWQGVRPLPLDRPDGPDTVADAERRERTLPATRTSSLVSAVKGHPSLGLEDVLLTALARAVVAWAGGTTAAIDLEGHGRQDVLEGLDVSRSVGWFTSIHPVALDADPAEDAAASLERVRARLAATPDRGLPHGLALQLSQDEELAAALAALPRPQIAFNHLGDFDQAVGDSGFRWLGSPNASSRSPRAARAHRLEVQTLVRDGELQATFTSSGGVHLAATVDGLADRFLAELEALVTALAEGPAAAPSEPDPFGWSQDELSDLLDEIERRG
jgi:amino acid adenylation domain-containing protein/non-ribosomal peptide synthase protein (TIGR01720 family)